MRRLLAVTMFALSASVLGQEPYSLTKADFAVPKSGGLAVPIGYLTIKDETTALATESILTFLGAGVTCVDNAGNFATECTITSGSGYGLIDNEGTPLTARGTVNFIGAGVDCVDDAGGSETDCTIAGGGGAPTTATYITQTADATLSAEQAMGALGTGIVINTTTTGVQSIYTGIDCTNQFVRDVSASGVGTCNSVVTSDISNDSVTLAKMDNANGSSKLVGSGDAGASADYVEINVGSGLAMTGTTLSATGGGLPSVATTMWARDEFLGQRSAVTSTCGGGGGGMGLFVSNTGAAAGTSAVQSPNDGDHPGNCFYSTGTDATGVTALNNLVNGTTTFDKYRFAKAETLEWLTWIDVLSDGTNTYALRQGFGDSVAGVGPTDGCWFSYLSGTSANWIINCNDNTGPTSATSATAVAAGAWVKLKIVVNSTATSVAFFVNGTEVTGSPLTTDIPTAAGREFGLQFSMLKSLGATARMFSLDYIDWTRTVAR